MDALLSMMFEAHHPERNHHRFYEIRIGRDLFGDWTVITRFGRIGQQGQERCFSSPTVEPLQQIIHDLLNRRLSAPRRIGCEYRLVTFMTDDQLALTEWMKDVLRRIKEPICLYDHRGNPDRNRLTPRS